MVIGTFTIPPEGPCAGSENGPDAAQPLARFIAGPENRLAGRALHPYFQQASSDYSPLVLYGPHGCGKSHLVHALVDWWSAHRADQRVRCLPAAEFARELAAAAANHRLEGWRRELAGLDLFVLEDLGQLSAKRAAQHELVQLLDALADRQVPVVVTARSLPTHSATLSPAVRSRLSAGLAVPLALPGPEARRAILEQLIAARGLRLSRRTVRGLADVLTGDVPTLVSALLELDLLARVEGQSIDRRRVREYLGQRQRSHVPHLREIASLTAKYFGLKLSELKSPERRQPLVAARGVAMYLARQLTPKSYAEIGTYFGRRDHTTVLHGCRRTESLLARDRATRQAVTELRRLLNAS